MNVWLFVLLFSVVSGISNQAIATLSHLKSLINHQNYSEAIQLGQKLQQQNPNSASVLFYTALAYQNNHQPEQAKSLYLKAIDKHARLPEAYNNLASIYVAEKNYLKAADTLTLAINSQHNIATAYANLSKIYRHLASQAYRQVLDDGIKKKPTKVILNTQLLATLELKETIKPILKSIITKTKQAIIKPNIVSKPTPLQNKPLPSAQLAISVWAKAWQNKQYTAYINSYSAHYAPKNLTHSQWLTQRNKRINRPGKISIIVDNFDIKLNNNKAYVNFDQAYRSKTYHDKVRKRMHLILTNGQWLITSEVTLSVL